jgi:monoamine oxidase
MLTRREWLGAAFGAAARTKRVIVVGAGMAGLAAALDLVDRGLETLVIEASPRPGGRVRTLREPFLQGQFAEAGASRIPDTHTLTLSYVRRFGLEPDPFYPTSGRRMYLIGGRRLAHPLDLGRVHLRLRADERRATLDQLWERYVMQPGRSISDRDADSITFTEFLRRQGASPGAQRLLWLPWELPAKDGSSALWTLRDSLADENETTRLKIRGGSDRLPIAMAAALGGRIVYGSPVESITQGGSGVTVRSRGREFAADRAVVAVSAPAMRRIRFDPDLPTPKRAAAESLRYDSVVRTYHQFGGRAWERGGWNGFATTDHPDDVWHPTHDQPGPAGILMSYMLGSRARESDGWSRVLARMQRAFPGLGEPIRSHVVDWSKEEWIWGPYAFQSPGQMLGLGRAAEAEGRIHFAGEHLSGRPSWMQGAIESGLRAAREAAGSLSAA